jgi:cell division protein FtsI/penicillin-binding protein 2
MSYRQYPGSPRGPRGSRGYGGYGGRRSRPVVPILITVVVLVVAAVVGWLVWPKSRSHGGAPSASSSIAPPSGPGVPPVSDAATAFATAWDAGNLAETPYARGVTGTDVQAAYKAITKNLQQRTVAVTVGSITPSAQVAGLAVDSAALTVVWTLPGGSTWKYDSAVQLTLDDGGWEVVWTPQIIQPDLGSGDSLSYSRTLATRATITDGAGQPIVEERPVVDIGVEPAGVIDANATASALATILKIDGTSLAARIKSAAPHQFVDVITLRQTDFDPVSVQVQAVPGVVLSKETEDLSPSHDFARAFVGTVGPVTKEIVDDSNGRYIAGDTGGLSGLEKEFDNQLGGTNGYTVSIVHTTAPAASGSAAGSASAPAAPVAPVGSVPAPTVVDTVAPINGTPLHTTLDQSVQNAADAALSTVTTQPSALVAVRVSTGQVIAVANGPYTGYDTALLGQTPPGSAFKIVTTLALLEGGFNVDTNVPCLAKIVVQGKTFQNYEGESFGDTPFHTDFAKSCNSAFISLRAKVPHATLPNAAKSIGIGACWSLGTAAFRGSVPVPATDVDLAATSFGQGQTLVSPVDLAVAAASVARGSYVAPSLLTNGKAPDCSNVNGVAASTAASPAAAPAAAAPVALPSGAVTELRALMREVVTDGTAKVLLTAPGTPVMAKTGTAEYGGGSTPKTHAWLVGYQGDIAFAVYVQDGQSGGTVAAPLALTFLQNLAATGTK